MNPIAGIIGFAALAGATAWAVVQGIGAAERAAKERDLAAAAERAYRDQSGWSLDEAVRGVTQLYDANGDGTISFSRWSGLLGTDERTRSWRHTIAPTERHSGRTRTKAWTIAEFAERADRIGNGDRRASREEMLALAAQWDLDRDGRLSRDEYAAFNRTYWEQIRVDRTVILAPLPPRRPKAVAKH